MYLNAPSITSLYLYLRGYIDGISTRTDDSVVLQEEAYYFSDLSQWVARYYDVKIEKGWWAIILFYSSGEKKAFEAFCRLYHLYLNDHEWLNRSKLKYAMLLKTTGNGMSKGDSSSLKKSDLAPGTS